MVETLIGTFRYLSIAKLDADGYPMGQAADPDDVTDGEVYGDYIHTRPVTIGGIGLNYETREGQGGGRVSTKRVATVSAPQDASLTLSFRDTVIDALTRDVTIDVTTNTNYRGTPRNAQQKGSPLLTISAINELDNVDGTLEYENKFIPACQIQLNTSGSGQGTGTNPNPLEYTIVPGYSRRLPWGELYSAPASNNDVVSDSDVEYILDGDYVLLRATYIGDGSTTADAFTLPYVPADTTTGLYYFFVEGVDDSSNISGISATGSVSVTTAVPSGERAVILYPAKLPLEETA